MVTEDKGVVEIVDRKARFNLDQTASLVEQVSRTFGEKPVRIQTQLDLFPGFDEVAILLKNGDVFRCLVTDGEQVSDWMSVPKGVQQ